MNTRLTLRAWLSFARIFSFISLFSSLSSVTSGPQVTGLSGLSVNISTFALRAPTFFFSESFSLLRLINWSCNLAIVSSFLLVLLMNVLIDASSLWTGSITSLRTSLMPTVLTGESGSISSFGLFSSGGPLREGVLSVLISLLLSLLVSIWLILYWHFYR